MKKLLLLLLPFFIVPAASATAIVVLVTPQYILIGADSKRQLLNGSAQVTAFTSVEKIKSVGSYCYAMAGITASSYNSFSADAIVSRHLSKAPYQKAVEKIKAEIKTALLKEMRFRQAGSQQLTSFPHSNDPLLEIVILRSVNGTPQAEILGFQLDNNDNIQVGSYTTRCPGDCPQQQQFYFMGAYGEMESQLYTRRGVQDPALLVEQLISAQSKATPSAVGGQIHLAMYTAKGLERIK